MNKYSNGKIYEINGGGLKYIGSTCDTLENRLRDHIQMKNYQKKHPYISKTASYQLLDLPDVNI